MHIRAERFHHTLIAFFVVFLGFLGCGKDDSPRESAFEIKTQRADDRVEVRADANQTTIAIHSPSGISHATIKRTTANWPPTVIVQLHLHGLESLRVSNRELTLNASVSSNGVQPVIRLWKDQEEGNLLDATSPNWMEIKILGSDSKESSVIPVREGFFELRLPPVLFQGNPQAIELQWIDFYRG